MTVKIVSKNPLFGKAPFEYAPGYVFTQDPACAAYDWLVVFDDLKADETVVCPKERTILATWEPVSIKNYCTAFTRQFGHLLTNRPRAAENHPHYHRGKGYFPWYNSRSYAENKAFAIPPKTKVVAAVCSAKAMKWTKHCQRIRLLRKMVAEIPGADWYGHGVHEFQNKCDLMDTYRYWTEKIADAFLCECLPFYAGAPDLAEDFPAESFIPIPVDDPDEAIRIMRAAIAADEWSKRLPAIRAAKARLFAEYNFWAQVIKVIEDSRDQRVTPADPARPHVLRSRKWLRRHTLSANLQDGWFHFKQYLSGVGLWPKMS